MHGHPGEAEKQNDPEGDSRAAPTSRQAWSVALISALIFQHR
jgi:hypothetical protein